MRRYVMLLSIVAVVALVFSSLAAAQTSSKILFDDKVRVGGDSHSQIFIMNTDGSGISQLTSAPDHGTNWGPCWSPDGTQICFTSNRLGSGDLFTMAPDGSDQQRLTNSQAGAEWSDWSPLGDKVAFTWYGVNVVEVGTGEETRLTMGGGASPSWSPGGSMIVFTAIEGDQFGIYVVPSSGGDPTRILDSGGLPDWSPVGDKIAYAVYGDIWYVPVDAQGQPTGSSVPVTTDGYDLRDDRPSWSPDGASLTYMRNSGKSRNPYTIMKVKADGTELQELCQGRNPERSPVLDNQPPVAIALGPSEGAVGQELWFDALDSYDPDGQIDSYLWHFDDGTTADTAVAAHTYQYAGTYDVSLTVTDDDGAVGADDITLTISGPNVPPVADANGPYQGAVEMLITFDGSGSSDSNGDQLWYLWEFGDGNDSGWSTNPTATHRYGTPDEYTATLTVRDRDPADPAGLESSDTASVSIAPLFTMHVGAITMWWDSRGNKRAATPCLVNIRGADDSPVVGATVYIEWTGATTGSASAVTTSQGSARFDSDWVRGSNLTFTLTVTDVVKAGWTYDPAANVETSDSVTTD